MAAEIQDSVYNLSSFMSQQQFIYDLLHPNNLDYGHYCNYKDSDLVKIPISHRNPPFKFINYNNNLTVINCGLDEDFGRSSSDGSDVERIKEDDATLEHIGMYKPYVKMDKNIHRMESHHRYNNNNHVNNNNNRSHNYKKSHNDQTERQAFGLMQRFRSHIKEMTIDLYANPPTNLLNGGPWDLLNKEIWYTFKTKIQSEQTYVNKLHLWKRTFMNVRRSVDSNCSLFLVGSTMSGFATEGSDIDMCLLTKPLMHEPRIDSMHHLTKVKQALISSGLANYAELISAKVPILKFANGDSGFTVDLNCNNGIGIRNTNLLNCYGRLDWRVRPLVVMVKLWAQANNINDAKSMTVSSYSWALMVIHFLQCGVSPAVLPCLHTLAPEKFKAHYENEIVDVQYMPGSLRDYQTDNRNCLGDLLIGFMQYYAFFDYGQYAISVRTGSRVPINQCKYLKAAKNDPGQWKCLCIEEPFDHSNTARSVYDSNAFKRIKDIMLASYKELARNKTLTLIMPVDLTTAILHA